MKEIFDRRYPVTSFFLLVTALVFLIMLITAGDSTSLYGLFAAIIILRYATRNPYIQQLGQSYLTLFVVNIIGSVLIPGISLAGHIGGAVGGASLAVIFPVRGERRMYSASQRLVALVLFVGLSVLLFYKGMGM